MAERTNSLFMKILDGGGRHSEFRKMSVSPDWIMTFPPNLVDRRITATETISGMLITTARWLSAYMAFSLHVFDRLSDDYSLLLFYKDIDT